MDRRPVLWALGVVVVLLLAWALLAVIGEQRLHSTPLWQRWHPLLLKSAAQTATPIETPTGKRVDQTIVETERGVYFLTGKRNAPAPGAQVIAAADGDWRLYLCNSAGERCMSIHSFCAGMSWLQLTRDADGKIEGCYAPRLANGSNRVVAAITAPPPNRSGAQGGRMRKPPSAGMTHPRLWAEKMGLPVAAAGN